jgi:bacterial leucyl aminopeptidase
VRLTSHRRARELDREQLWNRPRRPARHRCTPREPRPLFIFSAPFVPAVLSELKGRRLKLGIISNTGEDRGESVNSVLAPTGLLGHFDHALLVYSGDESPLPDGTPVTKRVPEIFRRAEQRGRLRGRQPTMPLCRRGRARTAGRPIRRLDRVSASAVGHRSTRRAGTELRPPHSAPWPDLTAWREELRRRAFVPQYFPEPGGATVHGVTSERLAGEFGAMGFGVDLLGGANLPQTTDLYLLRDDVSARTGFLSPRGEASVAFTSKGEGERIVRYLTDGAVIAALPGDRDPDSFHFKGLDTGTPSSSPSIRSCGMSRACPLSCRPDSPVSPRWRPTWSQSWL